MNLLKAGMVTLAITAAAIGCSDSKIVDFVNGPLGVETGELQVVTVTGGANLDPDGYELLVTEDEGPPFGVVPEGLDDNSIGVNDVWVERVTTGLKTVTLEDIAANCSVDANPQVATVPENGGVTVTFNLACS